MIIKGESKLRKTYSTKIDEKIIKKLKHIAVDKNKPANDILEEALNDYFKKEGGK